MKLIAITTSAVVCLTTCLLVAAEPPSPAVEEALGFLESGNYTACLRKIGIQLSATNAARPGTVDRFELLMLRGECLLRMRQPASAAAAYDAAAASMKTSRDVARVATATALSTLAKASPQLSYTPKAVGAAPIDIVNPESRPKALKALYDDRSTELTPEIIRALADKSLDPINALLPRAWELYSLEFATTGDAVQTVTNLKQLGTHARSLLRDELDRVAARVDVLKDVAADPTLGGNGGNGGNGANAAVTLRGLNEQERAELARLQERIVSLQRFAANGRRIGRLLGGTGESWDALLADCADARDAAQKAQQASAEQASGKT